MVLLFPVLIGIATVARLAEAAVIEYYATKYDHINIDAILNNRRMVNYYAACMLSKGPCPPEGLEFKSILQGALQTNCLRCTEKQKTVTLRVIRRLKKEHPKVWAQLAEQWDPDGIYTEKFEATFGTRQTEALPEASVQIQNRYDQENKDKGVENDINRIFTTSSSSSPPATSTSTIKTPSTISTSSTTPKISTTVTTNKANINTIIAATTKPTKRPRPNLGANIQATVDMVKSIEKIVGQIAQQKLDLISRFLTG